jgi:hypothetical protein
MLGRQQTKNKQTNKPTGKTKKANKKNKNNPKIQSTKYLLRWLLLRVVASLWEK